MSDHPTSPREPRFIQIHRDDPDAARLELLAGLSAPHAQVSPKFLYDQLGSRLFEAITELDEYYPTRAEADAFARHAQAMAAAIGPVGSLIDLGAGNCAKAASLFPVLRPQHYIAVDISVEFLREALRRVQWAHPALEVTGLGLDFSSRLALPDGLVTGRPVFFYPGSSIGNFLPAQALAFLQGLRAQAVGGGLLIGVDLDKSPAMLEPAYDDALGVTAAFNLNLLLHLNRLIGSNFAPRLWQHVAHYNVAATRIEMHLESRCDQTVRWAGGERHFAQGERLHTEYSCKYTVAGFSALLMDAGFQRPLHWTDEQGRFAVFWAAA